MSVSLPKALGKWQICFSLVITALCAIFHSRFIENDSIIIQQSRTVGLLSDRGWAFSFPTPPNLLCITIKKPNICSANVLRLLEPQTHTQSASFWPSFPPTAAAKFEAISLRPSNRRREFLDLCKKACHLGSIHPGLFNSKREAAVNNRLLYPDTRLNSWWPAAFHSSAIYHTKTRSAPQTNLQRQHRGQLSWPNLNADTISVFTPLVITGGWLWVTWEHCTGWLLDMNPMTFSVHTHTKPKFY